MPTTKRSRPRSSPLLAALAEKHGDGAIYPASALPDPQETAITTGCLALDLALGVGGLPGGRIVELFGDESTGKSTLALAIASRRQKAKQVVAWVDAEQCFDKAYAKRLGVDPETLLIHRPESGERALDLVADLARQSVVGLIVVDSVSALVPQAELDGRLEETDSRAHAAMLSAAFRKLAGLAERGQATLLFINQIRDQIDFSNSQEALTRPSGGRALRFYASARIELSRLGFIFANGQEVGARVQAKIIKSKFSRPFQKAEFDLIFGFGPDYLADALDMAQRLGLAESTKAQWRLKESGKEFPSRQAARAYYHQRPKELAALIQKLRKEAGFYGS